MTNLYYIFFEGELEKEVFKHIKNNINDEKIRIIKIHDTVFTYCSDKKKEDEYHHNITQVLHELKKVRQDNKDDNIKAIYIFDKVHLNVLKDKGHDYKSKLESSIIFISAYKTMDNLIDTFINEELITNESIKNKNKINKTENIKKLKNTILNKN